MTTRGHFAKYLERGAKIIVTAMPVGIAFLIVLLVSLWATTPQAHSFKPQLADTQKKGQVELIPLSLALFERPRFDKKRITATSERLDSKLEALSKQPSVQTSHRTSGVGTCTVTTILDSGAGSLRQCLLDVGPNATIDFDFQDLPPGFPAIILLLSPLPSITTDGLTIDGTGSSPVISGLLLSGGIGLDIDGADGVTIQGLQIMNFPIGIRLLDGTTNAVIGGETPEARNIISSNEAGVWIEGANTTNNQVLGNYIGTDASGMSIALGDQAFGVVIVFEAHHNIIGGETAGARNVISGHEWGIAIRFPFSDGNQVLGNYIGLNAAGTAALPNEVGLIIIEGAQENIIGGDTAGARNVISGNLETGVQLEGDGTNNNQVLGNYIGTDATGMDALGNKFGVGMVTNPQNNIIGGETPGAGNLISGNTQSGIQLEDSQTSGNQILGNYIGTDATGEAELGNYGGIVLMLGAKNNDIGGETEASRNIISGNGDPVFTGGGILITDEGSTGNRVLGNYIGTDLYGTQAVANYGGILIDLGASQNVIGGETKGTGNLISGNTRLGVMILSQGTTLNRVLGNRIGTDALGQVKIPNDVGVGIGSGATNNVIGTSGAGNLISGNNNWGIQIAVEGTEGNQILGNYIGTDVTGTERLGNEIAGILIAQGAKNNVIGGAGLARNIISGNNGVGIQLQESGTSGNEILGNYIGSDVTGTEPISNTIGVGILFSATNNVIGGETESDRNIISGNSQGGIIICGNCESRITISGNSKGGTTGNQVIGNYIGTDVTGSQPLKNGELGIGIIEGASDNVIGSSTAANLISGNGRGGVYLAGQNTTGNQIVGNLIGTDANGELAIPNLEVGIHIDSAKDNTIGINNTIAYNGEVGIRLEILANETPPSGNTITRNIIYQNGGLPIDWMDSDSIPAPPILKSYSNSDNLLAGTACPNCLVEFFASQSNEPPEGRVFLGEVTANASGEFTFTLNEPPLSYLSATATDSEGNTSEFSSALELKPIGGTPTPTPTATATASPTITATATSTTTPTPSANGLNNLYLPLVTR